MELAAALLSQRDQRPAEPLLHRRIRVRQSGRADEDRGWLSYFSLRTSRTFRIDIRSDIASVYAMRLRLRAPRCPAPRVAPESAPECPGMTPRVPRNRSPGHLGISPRVSSEWAPGSARNTQPRAPHSLGVVHVRDETGRLRGSHDAARVRSPALPPLADATARGARLSRRRCRGLFSRPILSGPGPGAMSSRRGSVRPTELSSRERLPRSGREEQLRRAGERDDEGHE